MFALKCGNAIIITPHHKAVKCSTRTVDMINERLAELGMPGNLIQILDQHSRENTGNLISMADVVVATGGAGMVKAAYSSGRPALGVGAGNVQCIIDRGIDYSEAVPKIVAGRSFDNGIICSGEQSVICPAEDFDSIMDQFEANGCVVIRDVKSKDALRSAMFEDGAMNRHAVGQSAAAVAKLAGISIPEDTRAIVIEADGAGGDDILAKEKMCPVIAAYKYDSFEEGVAIAGANLERGGQGPQRLHTFRFRGKYKIRRRDSLRIKIRNKPDMCQQRRRQLLERSGSDQHPWMRKLGPQQHIRKPGLQTSYECFQNSQVYA